MQVKEEFRFSLYSNKLRNNRSHVIKYNIYFYLHCSYVNNNLFLYAYYSDNKISLSVFAIPNKDSLILGL